MIKLKNGCPDCKKEIRGDSEKAAEHNYDTHREWHNKVKSQTKKTKGE